MLIKFYQSFIFLLKQQGDQKNLPKSRVRLKITSSLLLVTQFLIELQTKRFGIGFSNLYMYLLTLFVKFLSILKSKFTELICLLSFFSSKNCGLKLYSSSWVGFCFWFSYIFSFIFCSFFISFIHCSFDKPMARNGKLKKCIFFYHHVFPQIYKRKIKICQKMFFKHSEKMHIFLSPCFSANI